MIPESALIVPVPEAEPLVRDLRDRFDPAAPAGVPAHITVVYPFLDPDVLTTSITRDLEAMIAGVPVFRFELNAIARFPGVVYLVPEPAGPFTGLTAAVATRWPEAPPYGGIYNDVIPHVTIAHTSEADSIEKIRTSIEPALPVGCTAGEVLLVTSNDGRWSVRERFALGGIPV